MHTLTLGKQNMNTSDDNEATSSNVDKKEEHFETWETDTNCSKKSFSTCWKDMSSMYHDTWPLDRNMWGAESPALLRMETLSVMSFASSSGGVVLDQLLTTPDESRRSSQQLEAKVDMVYSLLAMLGGQEHAEMGETLLALSASPESCLAMRQSGCLPLLVQLVQSDKDAEMRKKAAKALQNLVKSQPDEKARKRELKILSLLEIITDYTESLENSTEFICDNLPPDGNKHPIQVISQIMKSSFDEGYRQAICQLGGIHSIAKLLEIEHYVHGSIIEETCCNQLRKYACMILTNLTFGDSGNKALLCSYKDFIRTLLMQLQSPNDELRQVTAGVLRNLSWRADSTSKEILREVGSVKSLMKAAMLDNTENTLISILSALWNLSAHCTENKSEICSVDGALIFLIRTLSYRSSSETLSVIENCGGILRNISSQIAGSEEYRKIFRKHNCFQVLVNQLKSTSLTVVSNACGTLWSLSSQNATDQEILWKLGAPTLLKTLSKSKHKMIAMGSSAALKNLLAARENQVFQQIDFLQPLDLRKQSNSNITEVPDVDLPLDLSQKRPELESCNIKSSSSTNLNVNELPGSFMKEKSPQVRTSCSSSFNNSIKSGSSLSCLPVRSKYGGDYEDTMEASERPFDFSRKYSEAKSRDNKQKEKCSNVSTYNYEKPKNENFSIYAETDLDQPTDYSLRYAENDSDSDSEECVNIEKTRAEFVGDTVKTYCTEGTPYETPFNFSTSTSMSDLRMNDKNNSDNDKNAATRCKTEEVLSGKIHCVPVENAASETQQPGPSKMKSELSSGLMSPEKPMNYCEEGTPGYFSRVSSFGSLNSSPVGQSENKVPEDVHKENNEVVVPKVDKIQPKVASNEVKVVKFESNVNYCEETPLMFSRSSSLGSLDSIEQNSIHDDRSSVISDYSRLTSGIISPSDLPDSPTQTIPPSPKPQKTPQFPLNHRPMLEGKSSILSNKVSRKPHVFEDHVTKFKEESTPMQFSTATSLSSLTIDDQDDGQIQGLVDNFKNQEPSANNEAIVQNGVNMPQVQSNLPQSYRNINRVNIPRKPRRQIELTSPRNTSNLPLFGSASGVSILTLPPDALPPPLPVENSVQAYCTEDTPAVLSHNGSISDLSLSTMSILDEELVENKVYLSENSSQSSEVHENIRRGQSEMRSNKSQIAQQCNKQDNEEEYGTRGREEGILTPPYITATDEVCLFAVENSPAQFSERSSLSNLTIGSSMMSDVNSFSLPKRNILEEGQSSCCAGLSFNEDCEENISNEDVVVDTSTEKRWSLSNQESDTPHQSAIFSEVEERASVDTLRNQSKEYSTKEENSDHLCESFSNLELKCINLEPQNGSISSDSLKKRKWKWKWKFGSDNEEPGYVKEKISGIESPTKKDMPFTVTKNEEVREENHLNNLGMKSLDSSYKKKKWWKWKFGAKGSEDCGTLAADVNKFAYLDIVPQNKELPSENPDVDSNKDSLESPSCSRKEDIGFIKSDSFKDNRSKSKRWKWKWKFSSKDGENPKPEEFMSLGLSKLKDSVSPVRQADCYINEDRLELPSFDNRRESRPTSVKLPSRFMRSASEPPNGNKSTGEQRPTKEESHMEELSRKSSTSSIQYFEVESDNVEEYKRVLTPNEKTPIHSISNIKESWDGQILNPTNAPKSCINDKKSLVNSAIDKSQRKPDFASLLEECIQLGMPKKKDLAEEEEINLNNSNASKKVTVSSGLEDYNPPFDHMAVIDKCIQLCIPITKDEVKSNSEDAGEYSLNFDKQIYDTVDAADVEIPKIMKQSKDTEINAISATMSLEKPSEVLSMLKDPNSSTPVRNLTEKSLSPIKYNEISKNDLEFLRRQLSIADKHLLQEALTRGISKEQEAFLIELLIMKRVIMEAKQSERPHNYTVGLNSSDESSQAKTNKIICYSEEPLDPVTLSIVKRILQRKSDDCEYNTPKPVDLFDKVNSENCNFEIVLEERIKITLAGNRGVQNTSKVNNEHDRENASVSRLCIQDNFSSVAENPTEKNQSQDASDICKHNSDVKDQPKRVDINKFINFDSCHRSGTNKNQKCNMLEISSSTSKLYENLSADSISKTLACNENSFKGRKDYAALVEECIKLGMPKKKELSEDALYANISDLPGYSRCHSLTRHEKISKFRTELNGNIQTTTSKTNTVAADTKALMEECIMTGMPKKNDVQITKNSYNLNSNKETDKGSIVEIEKKPDYKSLLEECIQLGMPKNKEVFSETRSCSPKPSTIKVNATRSQSVIPTSPLVRRIEQCISNANKSDTNEDPEEAIYANISATVGYSRLMPAKTSESNKKGLCDKQTDYSALVDECIKLGMPSRKRSEPNAIQEKRSTNETVSSKNPRYEALVEECIQLGMPKRKETSEDAIYANTLERYSNSKISPVMDFGCISPPPRRMLRSDSEPGFNKIPLVNVGGKRSGSAIPPYHSSMDRALEECIQLGWPKTKEMISSRRPVQLTTASNPPRNIDEGKTKQSESKNVNVASVVRNTPEYQRMCCKTLPTATGAEEDSKLAGAVRMIEVPEIEEVQQVEPEKNGYKLKYRVKIGI